MMQSLEIVSDEAESDEVLLLPPGTVIVDKDGNYTISITSSFNVKFLTFVCLFLKSKVKKLGL